MTTDSPRALTRRDALRGAAALCGLSLLSLGISEAQAAAPGNTGVLLPDGRVKITPSSIPALAKVGGVTAILPVKGTPAAVRRTGTNTYIAVSLRCPHAGAIATPQASGFTCNAHGSRFNTTGTVTNGPATSGLTRLKVVRSGKDLIIG
ncbi:MAG: ubiquinol-cytochrome c reductase iron-sulfur subunit [Actinomycetota bacterium]